ncbi:MAG: hypothetical protein M3367_03175 [Acidobacteriota bacterium]|nr:hypothetical protein [Acidobacteriota bacterium]
MQNWLENNFIFKKFEESIEIKSGHILRLKTGEIHLVGDVNEILGVCDDCTIFKKDDIEAIAHIYEKQV